MRRAPAGTRWSANSIELVTCAAAAALNSAHTTITGRVMRAIGRRQIIVRAGRRAKHLPAIRAIDVRAMDELLRDLRYALRMLRRAPAFALAAIGTLALGIGANVAVFSVVYGVLVRPLPYRDAIRLIVAHPEVDYTGAHRPVAVFVQPNEVEFWNRRFETLEPPALYSMAPYALAGDGGAEVIDAAIVSGSFFATLSGPISAGRPLQAGDDALPAAVISARLARRLFHDPAAAIGRRLTLNSHAYTIAGVAGDAFQFPDAKRDVWLPAGFERATSPTQCCGFSVIARLRPDATVDRGHDEIASAFTQLSAAKPSNQGQVRTRIVSLVDETVASVRPALLVLLAAVLMVLLVACSNLVNLLLARNAARAREFAVRRALGASAHRLMRQLLAESALLAVAGGVCGAALAGPCVAVLARIARDAVPRLDDVRLDWPVLIYAAAVAMVAALGTGILPALAVVRSPSAPNQSAAATSTQPARRLQKAVSAAQVALAVILLAGTALLGRSLARLLAVDLGVSTDHVLTAPIDLAFGGHPRDAEALGRVGRVIEQVTLLPGVRAVGIGTSLPPWPSRLRLTLK